MKSNRREARASRHNRVRATISGTASRPRMNVFRSLSHIYIQIIDDVKGVTLAQANTKELKAKGKKIDLATEAGKKAAEKALALGIKEVVFDRGGYLYHGRIKACAEGARAAGLKF